MADSSKHSNQIKLLNYHIIAQQLAPNPKFENNIQIVLLLLAHCTGHINVYLKVHFCSFFFISMENITSYGFPSFCCFGQDCQKIAKFVTKREH